MIAAVRWRSAPAAQLSLTIAMTMPASTITTIAPWSHSQVGDIGV
jgi:hypothetical protein